MAVAADFNAVSPAAPPRAAIKEVVVVVPTTPLTSNGFFGQDDDAAAADDGGGGNEFRINADIGDGQEKPLARLLRRATPINGKDVLGLRIILLHFHEEIDSMPIYLSDRLNEDR